MAGGFAAVGRRYQSIAVGAGTQQQLQVASCCELMKEAQHRLVLYIVLVIVSYLVRLSDCY